GGGGRGWFRAACGPRVADGGVCSPQSNRPRLRRRLPDFVGALRPPPTQRLGTESGKPHQRAARRQPAAARQRSSPELAGKIDRRCAGAVALMGGSRRFLRGDQGTAKAAALVKADSKLRDPLVGG